MNNCDARFLRISFRCDLTLVSRPNLGYDLKKKNCFGKKNYDLLNRIDSRLGFIT
jgi:hypothetical protein